MVVRPVTTASVTSVITTPASGWTMTLLGDPAEYLYSSSVSRDVEGVFEDGGPNLLVGY